MTACPDENTFVRHMHGLLSPEAAARVEAHADTCAACAALRIDLAKIYFTAADADETLPEPGDPAPAAGAKIGRYTVLERIGEGAMGVVVAAYDPALDRRVALKLLRAPSPAAEARMSREARAMANVVHPNVCTVHEVGTHEAALFVAMEFVDGGTLREWIRRAPRRIDEVLAVAQQAGRGLAAAHARGIVHRDFKPDNVLVGADGRARVTDFGLARTLAAPDPPGYREAAGAERDPALTRDGTLLGTPAYMAPEQLFGAPCDARADQFAFAVVVYELLAGARPFVGGSVDELRARVSRGEAPPLPGWVPEARRRALARALARDPGARFASMEALLDALGDPADPDAERDAKINAVAQGFMALVHLAVTAFVLYAALAPSEGGDGGAGDAAELSAGDEPLLAAVYFVLFLLISGWLPVGIAWTAANAWGLWRRRSWAHVSSIAYATFSLPTCLGTPYALYGLVTLTRPRVRAWFRRTRG